MPLDKTFENSTYIVPRLSLCQMNERSLHYHEHVELVIVTQGSVTMEIDGESRCLRRGDGAVVYPYVLHSYYCEEADSVYFIAVFTPRYYGEFKDALLDGKPRTAFFTAQQWMPFVPQKTEGLMELCRLNRSQEPAERMKGNAQFAVLFAEILTACGAFLAQQEDRLYRMAVDYCLEHFDDDKLTAEDVAAALSVSKVTLGRLFSAKHGGIKAYINLCRIRHAEMLLKTGDMSVAQVAVESGFSEIRTFNRAFKKCHGVTPLAYRKA